MPRLTKQQKEFRKQMKQLKKEGKIRDKYGAVVEPEKFRLDSANVYKIIIGICIVLVLLRRLGLFALLYYGNKYISEDDAGRIIAEEMANNPEYAGYSGKSDDEIMNGLVGAEKSAVLKVYYAAVDIYYDTDIWYNQYSRDNIYYDEDMLDEELNKLTSVEERLKAAGSHEEITDKCIEMLECDRQLLEFLKAELAEDRTAQNTDTTDALAYRAGRLYGQADELVNEMLK